MTTTQDASIGIFKEGAGTYKTFGAATRWFEFVEESLGWEKNIKQGQGLRVGKRVARSGRRTVPTAMGAGDWMVEAASKGQGLLWEGCLGTGVSTLVSGATYQQVFTLGDTLPSWSLQKGIPQLGGTVDPYSFLGAMVANWEFNCPNGDIANLKMGMDIGDLSTAQAYGAPSYPSEPVNLFHFQNGTIFNGTLTAPTATALASATTPLASVRSFQVAVNNNLTGDRFNFGGAGRKDRPTVGLREISGSLVVEYANTTFRDAVLNDTPMCLVFNLTAGALSSGLETLQLVLPEVKFDNELAKTNKTDLINQTMNFAVLDNLTAAQPLWVVTRTADTAL